VKFKSKKSSSYKIYFVKKYLLLKGHLSLNIYLEKPDHVLKPLIFKEHNPLYFLQNQKKILININM